jgi:hypothetical protein
MPALLTSMSNSMLPASFAAAASKVLHHRARVRIEPIDDGIESALVGKSRFIRQPEIDEDVHLARTGVLPVTPETGVIEIPALIDMKRPHGLTDTVGAGRPPVWADTDPPPEETWPANRSKKEEPRDEAQHRQSHHHFTPVISTRSGCILLTHPLHCRQDSRRGWHWWPLCASPPHARTCGGCRGPGMARKATPEGYEASGEADRIRSGDQ